MTASPFHHNETSTDRHLDCGIGSQSLLDGLVPPPRTVAVRIWLRLMIVQFINRELSIVYFGGMTACVGLGFVISGEIVGLGWMLMCLGICIGIGVAYILLSGTRQVVRVLTWGESTKGYIDQIFSAGMGKYQAYANVLGEMATHQRDLASTGIWKVLLKSPFRNWKVKFLVKDAHGRNQELDGRMNLEPWASNEITDSQVLLLVDGRSSPPTCLAVEQFPWLDVSHSGELAVHSSPRTVQGSIRRSLARALQVVVPTYCLSALGLAFGLKPLFVLPHTTSVSVLIGVCIVPLLTFTHGVAPIFAYKFFIDGLNLFAEKIDADRSKRRLTSPMLWLMSGFGYLHMAVWYGGPIIVLALLCGWISVAWGISHVLLAGHGHRWWVFLQHGSTSMALVLFVLCFSGDQLFPVGILVVLFQSLLLTIVEWKGKNLWATE